MTNMFVLSNIVSASCITKDFFHVFGWTVENAHFVVLYNTQKWPFSVNSASHYKEMLAHYTGNVLSVLPF
jgi:hypothetical protein